MLYLLKKQDKIIMVTLKLMEEYDDNKNCYTCFNGNVLYLLFCQNDKPKKYKSVDEDNDHADALQNLQNEGKDTTESDVVEMGEKQ